MEKLYILVQFTLKHVLQTGNAWWHYFNQFKASIPHHVVENIVRLMSCGQHITGYTRYECEKRCGHIMTLCFTCKSRLCPSCGKKATEQWIAKQNAMLPKCDYQHVTYTMPAALWPFFKASRKLLNRLSKLAADTLIKAAHKKKTIVGIFTALHTFGRDLKWNCHIHLSVTRGGLSLDLKRWKDIFFKSQNTMKMWRYAVIDLLRQEYKAGNLEIPYQYQSQVHNLRGLNRILNTEYQKGWHVYFAAKQTDYKQNVNYLGRYLKRPPIAQSRLKHYDGTNVVFEFLDHKDKRHKHFHCTAFEFIERLIQHIPAKSFKMVRYYGVLSFRTRGKLLQIIYKLLGQVVTEPKKITYADLFKGFLREDPFKCIVCGARMVVQKIKKRARLSKIMEHHEALATMQWIR